MVNIVYFLQFWCDLFIFIATTSLWLMTARGAVEVISTAASGRDISDNILTPIPNDPPIIEGRIRSSTMDAFNLGTLEFAISGLIQMLLVMAGIETNPGPTTPTYSQCCNASQHFNRVKKVIAKVHQNFQTKVEADTLTKPAIEIHEAGE